MEVNCKPCNDYIWPTALNDHDNHDNKAMKIKVTSCNLGTNPDVIILLKWQHNAQKEEVIFRTDCVWTINGFHVTAVS